MMVALSTFYRPIRYWTKLPRSRLGQLQQLSSRGSFRRAYCVLVPKDAALSRAPLGWLVFVEMPSLDVWFFNSHF
jgi:hypothetical protein